MKRKLFCAVLALATAVPMLVGYGVPVKAEEKDKEVLEVWLPPLGRGHGEQLEASFGGVGRGEGLYGKYYHCSLEQL